jgi:hypothetical protein
VIENAPEELVEVAPGASFDLSVTYRPLSTTSRSFSSLLITNNSGGTSSSTRVRLRGLNPLRQSNSNGSALTSSFGTTTQVNSSSVVSGVLSASVFPNPVVSVANLRIDAPENVRSVTVAITNIVGKTVRQLQVNTNGSTTVPVEVSDLNSGMYLLRVVDNSGKEAYTVKLLKQ